MRHNAFDNVNLPAAVGFVFATVSGWTVQEWAAAAALGYSLILIGEKVARLIRRKREGVQS
ncbi:hypothetical protein [Pseudoxanthomonas sp. PXM04]|uniref:hypothetical protein n=1 Tax=Pseudoxanthomonas sp. PXM04 TaxID=2769297 RepID=UPI001CE10063|nr:hypothetical protein [Pseudoxanthomonas sp. PXM04]